MGSAQTLFSPSLVVLSRRNHVYLGICVPDNRLNSHSICETEALTTDSSKGRGRTEGREEEVKDELVEKAPKPEILMLN